MRLIARVLGRNAIDDDDQQLTCGYWLVYSINDAVKTAIFLRHIKGLTPRQHGLTGG